MPRADLTVVHTGVLTFKVQLLEPTTPLDDGQASHGVVGTIFLHIRLGNL